MKKRIPFPLHEIAYLKSKSSEMKALIELLGEVETYFIEDPFIALVNSIVYQSISFKAANTIWERFVSEIPVITPQSILKLQHDDVRSIGLSNPKTNYIFNVARAFHNKTINTNFEELTDEEVIEEVTKIKGIGRWSAEMFLIFSLLRKNVISYGDIAIRKGIEWLYDIDHKLTIEEFNYYQELFTPFCTTASHYLWEITVRNHWNKKKD